MMKREKITDFIYNFENVLRRDTFFTLSELLTNAEGYHVSDVRPGNSKMTVKNDLVFGLLAHMREQVFAQIPELQQEGFGWQTLDFQWCNALAKGPVKEAHWHTDGKPTELMIVFYFHHTWREDWNGCLQFDNVDIIPKPNSCVVFPANIHHRIQPSTLDAQSWRYSVTFPTTVTDQPWRIDCHKINKTLSELPYVRY